jgi:hypothetical protein
VEGRLVARGERGRPIRFTSSHARPRNGDWSMVKLVGSRGSAISHCVFEFSQHGLNIWNSDIEVSHVVIRYANWEGLYAENDAKVTVRNSRIYGNGYNCIAVEQSVFLKVLDSYIGHCGTVGIHVDSSRAQLAGNLLEGSQEGLSLDNDAQVILEGNRFSAQKTAGVTCGDGRNRLLLGRNTFDGLPLRLAVDCDDEQRSELTDSTVPPPEVLDTGASEGTAGLLTYLPGDRWRDPYPYVYPLKDETREVDRRLGKGLGLTWSAAWDGEALWTANLDAEVYRLDPDTGAVLRKLRAPGPQPWGMTFDGRLLWINDFARRTIFALQPQRWKVVRRFRAPDPRGGCKGLAWDGRRLHALGWASHRLYTLSPQGEVQKQVPVPSRDLGGGVKIYAAGGLTWDGEAFWAPMDHLVRFDGRGKLLGWIHGTSERVWDLTWDGQALWTTQRANENWTDIPRLFRLRIVKLQRPWRGGTAEAP